MSSALSTSLAPWRISAWQPRDSGEWIEPGSANTSRPYSAAWRAVISEPDCSAASTTSVPRDRPAMMRLRMREVRRQRRRAGRELADQHAVRGNAVRQRAVPRRVHPVQPGADHGHRAARALPARPRGRRRRCRRPGRRRWSSPARLRCAPKARALSTPCALALRLPTMARQRRLSSPTWPCTYSSNGGSAVCSSSGRVVAVAEGQHLALFAAGQPLPRRVQARLQFLGFAAQGLRQLRRRPPAASADLEACEHRVARAEAASSRRAPSRPSPGVSSSRNQAANSSASSTPARWNQGCVKPSPGKTGTFDRQDQRVRSALEDAEDEQQAVLLVRQLQHRAFAVDALDQAIALAPQRQHMAALDTVARAAVERDDLVLAGAQARRRRSAARGRPSARWDGAVHRRPGRAPAAAPAGRRH